MACYPAVNSASQMCGAEAEGSRKELRIMKKLTSVVVLFVWLLVLVPGMASAETIVDLEVWCAFESQDWDVATQTCTVNNTFAN
jgi:hypothetical protein